MDAQKNLVNLEKATSFTVLILVSLGILQIFLGELFIKSVALTANGIDCLGDGFVSVVVWLGIKYFKKPADGKFHFGYYKIENLASIAAALVMFILAGYIGFRSYLQLIEPHEVQAPLLGIFVALIAAIIAWILGFYKYFKGKKTGLKSLQLEALNTIKDGSASFLTVIALIVTALGYPAADAFAGFIIAIIIISIGYATIKEAGLMLVDACDSECLFKGHEVKKIIENHSDVSKAHVLRLRRTGPYLQGEVEILVDEEMKLKDIEKLRGSIIEELKKKYPDLKKLSIIAVSDTGVKNK